MLAHPDGATVGVKVSDGCGLECVPGDVGVASAVSAVGPFIDFLYRWAGALVLVFIGLALYPART